jgi:hypothetical protein
MQRIAECHCGQLKAMASGEPERSYLCHCQACQRRTGTAFHWGSFWRTDQVEIAGERKTYERGTAAGTRIRFYFCPNCGSNVFWDADRFPGKYGIAAGSFADPNFPPPTSAVYEESMHPWLELPTVTEHHARGLTRVQQ